MLESRVYPVPWHCIETKSHSHLNKERTVVEFSRWPYNIGHLIYLMTSCDLIRICPPEPFIFLISNILTGISSDLASSAHTSQLSNAQYFPSFHHGFEHKYDYWHRRFCPHYSYHGTGWLLLWVLSQESAPEAGGH